MKGAGFSADSGLAVYDDVAKVRRRGFCSQNAFYNIRVYIIYIIIYTHKYNIHIYIILLNFINEINAQMSIF